MKALKIKFEVKKEEAPYDPDFVKTVLKAEKEIKNGKGKKISSDSFDNPYGNSLIRKGPQAHRSLEKSKQFKNSKMNL